MRRRFWYLGNGTSLHVIAVTNDCNFACKYCYAASANKDYMTPETARKVVDFAMQSPAKFQVLEFSGGEPLLNFEAIKAAVERAKEYKEKKIAIAVVQNGSNWDREKALYCIKNHIGVCFSLDGPEDLHNLHRPYRSGGGTYKDVVKWIDRFRRWGHSGLHALPVITRYSLSRGREIVDEYLSHGIRVVRFKYIGYFGRAPALWKELGYTPEEFVRAWKDVIEYMYELNRRGIFVVENMAQIMARKLFNQADPGYCELQMPCGAGLDQLAYSPDGSVYTCDEGRMFEEFKLGNVEQPYSQVMKNSTLKEMILASSGLFDLCDHCELKPFCGVCPVESYRLHGKFHGKIMFDRRHKIHGAMLRYLIKRSSEDTGFRKMLISWLDERRRLYYFGDG